MACCLWAVLWTIDVVLFATLGYCYKLGVLDNRIQPLLTTSSCCGCMLMSQLLLLFAYESQQLLLFPFGLMQDIISRLLEVQQLSPEGGLSGTLVDLGQAGKLQLIRQVTLAGAQVC